MEGKTGLDWGLVAEFFEAPVVVVKVDEGGDGGAEPLGPEPAEGLGAKPWKRALDWKKSVRYWEPWSWRSSMPRAAPGTPGTPPRVPARAWARGSQAAKRSPVLQTCQPRHSPFQCSRSHSALSLPKGSKSQTQPSSVVRILAPSVAQRTLGASVMMRPSCALAGAKARVP